MDTLRWYRRALPVTALAVGLVALLALAFPGVRDQVRLSATHVPQKYVALSFDRTSAGPVDVCARTGDEVRVRFVVDSELSEARSLAYVVTVGAVRRTGTVDVEPGETADVTQVVNRSSTKKYDVTVQLPGEDRQIVAHCPGVDPRKAAQ